MSYEINLLFATYLSFHCTLTNDIDETSFFFKDNNQIIKDIHKMKKFYQRQKNEYRVQVCDTWLQQIQTYDIKKHNKTLIS